MAEIVTASRVYPTCGVSYAQLGQARVAMPSTSLPRRVKETWMPGSADSLRSLRKLDCVPGMTVERTDDRTAICPCGCARTGSVRPSARPVGAIRDRDVGALLLFRQHRARCPLHGEVSAAARPGRGGDRLWRGQGGARIPVRSARRTALRLATVRLLYRACLFGADPGRPP